jgi:hypothetical protein
MVATATKTAPLLFRTATWSLKRRGDCKGTTTDDLHLHCTTVESSVLQGLCSWSWLFNRGGSPVTSGGWHLENRGSLDLKAATVMIPTRP